MVLFSCALLWCGPQEISSEFGDIFVEIAFMLHGKRKTAQNIMLATKIFCYFSGFCKNTQEATRKP